MFIQDMTKQLGTLDNRYGGGRVRRAAVAFLDDEVSPLRDLAESIAELRQIADGRDDILAEAAGISAGPGMPGPPPMSAMSSSPPNSLSVATLSS
jgi:hypothetical protein